MALLGMVDWASALIGFGSGLLLLLAGKALDYHRTEQKRDLAQATILGELRAGFSGLSGRVAMLESRVAALADRMDRHNDAAHQLYMGEQQ